MKIGFTGTQAGMNPRQKEKLRFLLKFLRATEFHHGDCVGADAEAHDIATELGIKTIGHPPSNPSKRAYCNTTETRKEYPYLVRNHHIVDDTEVLIAAPKTNEEELRSGTWATVRYSRQLRKKRWVCKPMPVLQK